ncbi:hypothetical protein J2Z26_001146 [Bacillus luteolus]|nr:hypothetical protein [Cytobacillus luteolus]
MSLLTILETHISTSITLEAKNPPRYQNAIVTMIQGFNEISVKP